MVYHPAGELLGTIEEVEEELPHRLQGNVKGAREMQARAWLVKAGWQY